MLKNFWYACEFSQALTNRSKQIVLWQQTIVLYRDSTGQVVALKDRCPHRGAALSLGKVEGDCLRCPYHGWKFQSDGTCNEIPANPPGVAIHPQAGVQSYPVEEKYGFIWLFWGDLPPDECPPIPSLPEFPDSSYRAVTVELEFQAHYSRLLENLFDPVHATFVHVNTFGGGDSNKQQFLTQGKLILRDWGASSIAIIQQAPLKAIYWQDIGKKKNSKVKLDSSFYLPNLVYQKIDFKSGLLFCIALVPIDDRTTKVKLMCFRNFLTHSWFDRWFRKLNLQILQEDKPVVESQRPYAVPNDINAELHVAGDALAIAYRQLLQKCLKME
ncbi:MAG: aromatic ring-hydroxylating dioxygenase subunit alpha [Cyanosarcina radialis HA8281-LM2]|jgi:phenylpropionate dioxygenase-like ring-hydroxylating dioxygenase large terminal subunit|nr:aromatic ring-hydroxylating dioxygenase subunit alpha [Cyanosarcina radialis HA8281-LM2]